jgi:S-(hydroxymethyl)glutathione dehydrogenase/alcohol dehydrogenase
VKAAVCRAIGQVSVEEIDEPHPEPGEVGLEMVATGVCGTDLSIFRGHLPSPFPIVLGHEGVGIVREVGPEVRGLAVGDHVVCTIIPSCGRCFYCVRGEDPLCEEITVYSGRMLDGTTRLASRGEPIHSLSYQASFAERAIVPERVAIRVPAEAPLERLVGLACGVSTGLGAALLRAPVEPGSSVLVVGAGGVGLSVLMGARLRGAGCLIAADVVPARLERARALGLAEHTIDARHEPLAERVRAITGGRGADRAFDAAGAQGTLEAAVEATRPGGSVVAIGLADVKMTATFPTRALLRQRWVTGTFGGSIAPRRDIPAFVDLYLAGRLDLESLLDATYRLEELPRAFDDLAHGRVTRGAIRF